MERLAGDCFGPTSEKPESGRDCFSAGDDGAVLARDRCREEEEGSGDGIAAAFGYPVSAEGAMLPEGIVVAAIPNAVCAPGGRVPPGAAYSYATTTKSEWLTASGLPSRMAKSLALAPPLPSLS